MTLSGDNGEQFRGFFVQARVAADDSRTGTFGVVDGDNSQLSSCPTDTVSRYNHLRISKSKIPGL